MPKLGLKDFLTLCNGASGVSAVFLAMAGLFYASAFFIALAAVFDFFDGKVARSRGKENVFGRELDSLNDVVSFAVAPVILAVMVNGDLLVLVASVFYVLCGLMRLALFNVQREKGVYFGLPIPGAAVAAVASALVIPSLMQVALIALGVLMVARFKIKK